MQFIRFYLYTNIYQKVHLKNEQQFKLSLDELNNCGTSQMYSNIMHKKM